MVAYDPISVPNQKPTVPHDSPQVPFAEQLRYWARQLDGASAPELPTDRTRPTNPPSSTAAHTCAVPRDVSAKLLALTAQLDVTLLDLMVAACQLVLARHSGHDDIVVATAAPHRDHPIALRSDVRDCLPF
ncbi:MAG: condensation domain-containing protein, partial [Actinomycetes bacterium]